MNITTEHSTIIKWYMGNDYQFDGSWETLMPIVQKLVWDGNVLIWKIARPEGETVFSCSLGDERVKDFSKDGYECLYAAVMGQLKHSYRYKDARAN